ncbi:GGDEF domain-containing protein [Pelovirga terrestris]|uniref:diguanylate cyclase n=1 Tax=Pelovirga terrestris TaxID=2771352 RepID=A0A8J6QNA5_9BACT|nr:GGDEF domain-containing protein [Pelovirga terrestris]MBD1400687.1 GGDEF domain-containing protein [Pelovirga terrestris]
MPLHNTDNNNLSSRFFARLMGIGMLSILAILILAGLGLNRTYHHQIFDEAKLDAVQIVAALIHFEGNQFIKQDSRQTWQIEIGDDQIADFDLRLRDLLKLFDISKIKIFDHLSRVVYSTDPAIIGQRDDNNQRLANALAGQVDSSLKHKEVPVDLADEQNFKPDVVGTYVPVVSKQGQVIGVIEIYKEVTHYQEIISSLIWKNVSILAIVLFLVASPAMLIVKNLTGRLAVVQAQLKNLANIDQLTGVLARREIMAQALSAGLKPLPRQEEHKEKTNGLMMLDIDHFKQINDNHGHLTGDLVLKIIAQRIQTSLRQQDLVGRFGGEEFLIILPNSSLETTHTLAERCRKHICETPISCNGKMIDVTASIGISWYRVGSDEPAFMSVLNAADKALYQAKAGGRNQTQTKGLPSEKGGESTTVSH